jgi:RimJ/RimL family protein N-acetyltransferase
VIRLEPLAAEHLSLLRALVADPAMQRFTRVPVPTPPEFPERWLAGYVAGREDGTRIGFAVVDGDTDEPLGVAFAPTIEPETATAELGYAVLPGARGRGVATAALHLLTEWALSELGAERLELRISVDNAASKRVAERCGYVREGVLRSLYFKDGVREDTEVWSRLASDRGVGVTVQGV